MCQENQLHYSVDSIIHISNRELQHDKRKLLRLVCIAVDSKYVYLLFLEIKKKGKRRQVCAPCADVGHQFLTS